MGSKNITLSAGHSEEAAQGLQNKMNSKADPNSVLKMRRVLLVEPLDPPRVQQLPSPPASNHGNDDAHHKRTADILQQMYRLIQSITPGSTTAEELVDQAILEWVREVFACASYELDVTKDEFLTGA